MPALRLMPQRNQPDVVKINSTTTSCRLISISRSQGDAKPSQNKTRNITGGTVVSIAGEPG